MILRGVSLLVLAGGESSRMGSPKHLLPFHGTTFLECIMSRLQGRFDQIMLAGKAPCPDPPHMEPVQDVMAVKCPLVGILSGLRAARNPRVFVLGCDMPFVEPALVEMLCTTGAGADVVVPVIGGFMEPLCAVYRASTSTVIENYLREGGFKTTGFFGQVKVTEVAEARIRGADPALNSFINLNTPEDYRRICLT